MSYGFSRVGIAGAVAAKIAEDVAKIKCPEPEETVKNAVGGALVTALEAFPLDYAVEVNVSGSQYTVDGKAVNSLTVALRPLGVFIK